MPTVQDNQYYETAEFNAAFDRLVEVSRNDYQTGLEKGRNLEGLAEDLYAEMGHYVYELLQNAEDAHATEVKFTLKPNSLTFSHNGSKFFTFEDIRAITTYGGGTKSEDSTKIGRFGIGFKATSRITDSPRIRSNQFAFQIHNQEIPERINSTEIPLESNYSTTFVFPFGTKKFKADHIEKETLATLLKIDSKNLLFLQNINTVIIEYIQGGSKRRILGKQELENNLVRLRESLDGTKNSVTSEFYLKYQKRIDSDELSKWAKSANLEVEEKSGSLSIAIAIKAEVSEDSVNPIPVSIKPIENSKLFVFFPANNEFTGLNFHIHAPFASTTTRESIKEGNPVNDFLFENFSIFVPEVLSSLVERGLLTQNGLEVLPNRADQIRPELLTMRDQIYRFFKSNIARIPMADGSYAKYAEILEISNDVGSVFSADDLNFICSFNASMSRELNQTKFIKKPVNTRSAKFLNSLEISTFDLKALIIAFSYINSAFAISKTEQMESFIVWFSSFEIEKLRNIYELFANYDSSKVRVYFSRTPIIRISDQGKFSDIPERVFVDQSGTRMGENFLNPQILNFSRGGAISQKDHQIWRFLDAVGVRQFSKSMLLEEYIVEYRTKLQSGDVSEIIPDESIREELSSLLLFVHGDVELERAVSQEKIFLTEEPNGELGWHRGSEVYVDLPFTPATGLDSVMPKLDSAAKKFRLWPGYSQIPRILTILERLEVTTKVGAVSPSKNLVPEWTIPGIEKYLEYASITLRKNLWNYLKSSDANRERHYLRFPNSYTGNSGELSSLAKSLADTAWIPDKKGDLKKPRQLEEGTIDPNFLFEKCDFLTEIGFGADSAAAIKAKQEKIAEKQRKDEAAKLFGLSDSEMLEKLLAAHKKNPKKFEQLMADLNRPEMADHLANPLKIAENVRAETAEMPDIQMVEHSIFEREGADELTISRKNFLRDSYMRENSIECQVCSTSSFIKTTNGEPFFVAIMVIPRFSKNSIFNVVALCGQCSAKFKWGRTTTDDEIKKEIILKNDYSGNVKIDVVLGGQLEHINFIESHFVKLKGALGAE